MAYIDKLTDILKRNNQYQKILNVLNGDDYIKIASVTYDICMSTLKMPLVKRTNPKEEMKTNTYLKMGYEAFMVKGYELALQYYNLALSYAPLDSYSYFLSIYKRALLFCEIRKYSAAYKDMDTYLSIGFNDDLSAALVILRDKCKAQDFYELVFHNNVMGDFNDLEASTKFFQLTGDCNSKFPFANNKVDIVIKDGEERIIAQSDIKVGEIVVIEPAYVVDIDQSNKSLVCYYCNKYADNLIPCRFCSSAMFCDEACKHKCWAEYHEIECAMSEIISILPDWYCIWLKYVMKTWRKCKNLDEFLEMSEQIDSHLQKQESITPLDINKRVSYLLPPKKDSIKKYGKLYDAALFTAFVMYGLKKVDVCILRTTNTDDLINNIAKQVLYHVMHSSYLTITGASMLLQEVDVVSKKGPQKGAYPFLSRLTHSCSPNMMTLGLTNKTALICVSPVKAGRLLTAALTCDEYFDCSKNSRLFNIYHKFGFVCNCMACVRNWDKVPMVSRPSNLPPLLNDFQWITDKDIKFRFLCQWMTEISHSPATREYVIIYKMFVNLIKFYQHGITKQRFQGRMLEDENDNLFKDFIKSQSLK